MNVWKLDGLVRHLALALLPVGGVYGLSVIGLPPALSSQVETRLRSGPQNLISAEQKLRSMLRSQGYYTPTIVVTRGLKKDGADAQLAVSLGERLLLDEVLVSVPGDLHLIEGSQALLEKAQQQVGQPLDHAQYEAFKTDLLLLVVQAGYLDAKFVEHRLEVDLQVKRARWLLTLAVGERYVIGEISYTGSQIQLTALDHFRALYEKQPYASENLAALTKKLLKTGWFSQILIVPSHQAHAFPKRIPLNVMVEPKKRLGLQVRLGFSSDLGRQFGCGAVLPWCSSKGDQLDTEVTVTFNKKVQWHCGYRCPWGADPLHSYVLCKFQGLYPWAELHEKGERLEYAAVASVLRGFALSRGLKEAAGECFGGFYQYRLNTEAVPVSSPEGAPTSLAWSNAKLGGLKVKWLQEAGWRTAWGSFYSVEGAVAIAAVMPREGADALCRVSTRHAFTQTFGSNVALALRLEQGQLWTTGRIESLPFSMRFFAGGEHSIRGYKPDSLSEATQGVSQGAVSLGTFSLNGFYRVHPSWWISVFFEGGAAVNQSLAVEAWKKNLSRGLGVGACWETPIGAISGSIAFPLDLATEGQWAFRVYLKLGESWKRV